MSNENLSYSLGMILASNLGGQIDVNDIEFDNFLNGFREMLSGSECRLSAQEANAIMQSYMTKMNEQRQAQQQVFLQENKKKEGVEERPSGLQYKVLESGNGLGKRPSKTDKVTVHYHGMLTDGTVFDSSVERNEPASFPVNGVIQGWQEALPLMSEGEKWRLFIPAELGYGDQGAGNAIPPGATLIFDVELLKVGA